MRGDSGSGSGIPNPAPRSRSACQALGLPAPHLPQLYMHRIGFALARLVIAYCQMVPLPRRVGHFSLHPHPGGMA